jgi:NADPH-dependent F420 reductase
MHISRSPEEELKIAVLGGTGDLGRGLALRLAKRHDVVIGSRDRERAASIAKEAWEVAKLKYGEDLSGSLLGSYNEEAAEGSDMAFLTIRADSMQEYLAAIRSFSWRGQVLVSPVSRFVKEEGVFRYSPFEIDGRKVSAAELVQEALGDGVRVVAGLHSVPARRLSDPNDRLDLDVLLAGEREAVITAAKVLADVEGLRPLFAGPLSLSPQLEALTPLLLNISVRNKLKEPSIRVVARG